MIVRFVPVIGAVGLLLLAGCNLGVQPVTYTTNDESQANWPLNPNGAVSGDVDGDGDLDLVAVGQYGHGVLFNDGDGTYTLDIHTTGTTPGQAPALADFDGDGDRDLVSVMETVFANHPLGLRRNDGTGHFGFPEVLQPDPPAGGITDVAAVDADNDGDTDLVFASQASGRSLGVYLNDGTGGFGLPAMYPTGFVPGSIGPGERLEIADVDADGDDDAVVTYESTVLNGSSRPNTAIAVLLNDGAGAYAAKPTLQLSYHGTYFLLQSAVADFDGDDIPDLALGWGRSVVTLHGDGTGGFESPQVSQLTEANADIFVMEPADVDGDGKLDLVGSFGPAKGIVAYGDGAGGFDESHYLVGGTSSTLDLDVLTTDLEDDGDPDIVFVGGNTIGVVENAVDGRPTT